MGLDTERLSNLDEYGDRIKVIPAEVRGFYRRHRTWTQFFLLLIFLVLPWTKINGEQSLLLDIAARKFAVFGITFWAHDAPLIFFILGTLTVGLAFVTSVWGRIWCGWACPQTVFIDAVFRRIEVLVQGNYIQRRKLDQEPLTLRKLWKVGVTWFLFLVVSSLISHSFVAYFVGAENLIGMIQGSPIENWNYFLIITGMTVFILLDFGWFREQFCIIMCPYGRFQSVLLDQKSLAIVYDTERGEPRKGAAKAADAAQGDCVSCNRCVQVCPTGIDIRRGLQMECIACTACADACDEIMTKVKKPKGLIRYDSLDGTKIQLLKPRSVIYMLIILIFISGLAYNIAARETAQVFVMRGQEAPFTVTKDERGQERILNHFKLQIQNQNFTGANYRLKPPVDWQQDGTEMIVAQNPQVAKAGEMITWHFFVRFKPELLSPAGKHQTHFLLEDLNDVANGFKGDKELILIGPARGK
jgi:cytochrome c oxidase accessory protein FixG